jgi:hypothetical protein
MPLPSDVVELLVKAMGEEVERLRSAGWRQDDFAKALKELLTPKKGSRMTPQSETYHNPHADALVVQAYLNLLIEAGINVPAETMCAADRLAKDTTDVAAE